MQVQASWPLILITAPFIGSFLGVLIRRLPGDEPVFLARSRCETCGRTLTSFELVPLLSYILQRGRCRGCGQPIRLFHLVIEVAAVVVAAWAILTDTNPARQWLDCLLGWTLLTLSWIDFRCMWLPDVLTLPLLLAGLALGAMSSLADATAHAAGAAVGYLGLRGIAWSYRVLRGREGVGRGDAKLLGAAGAWLGVAYLPYVLLLAAVLGLLMAACLIVMGRRLHAHSALPFGPCLALSFWLIWLYGDQLISAGGVV
jgi:leader peptidase (prepilin peptidase) / N-methyltransferase